MEPVGVVGGAEEGDEELKNAEGVQDWLRCVEFWTWSILEMGYCSHCLAVSYLQSELSV